jgi:hypothetical protein
MFHIKVVEKIKTYFMFNYVLSKSYRYEIMWEKTVEQNISLITIYYDACALHVG